MNRPELSPRRDSRRDALAGMDAMSVFVVQIGDDKFGLPIEHVRAVVRTDSITPIPLAPDHYIGLMNLRGRVVTAVDLRMCIGRHGKASVATQLAVGVEIHGEDFALTVDDVREVTEVHAHERIVVQRMDPRRNDDNVLGVFNTPHGIVTVLDIANLIAGAP